jgi:hypothetical protein
MSIKFGISKSSGEFGQPTALFLAQMPHCSDVGDMDLLARQTDTALLGGSNAFIVAQPLAVPSC